MEYKNKNEIFRGYYVWICFRTKILRSCAENAPFSRKNPTQDSSDHGKKQTELTKTDLPEKEK